MKNSGCGGGARGAIVDVSKDAISGTQREDWHKSRWTGQVY